MLIPLPPRINLAAHIALSVLRIRHIVVIVILRLHIGADRQLALSLLPLTVIARDLLKMYLTALAARVVELCVLLIKIVLLIFSFHIVVGSVIQHSLTSGVRPSTLLAVLLGHCGSGSTLNFIE